ncbi:MAG: methyltransferase, TrmH family [Acidobacteriota bacterium]|nr:methyltransferase, TrmH family [Acidobacteriota bacterium]
MITSRQNPLAQRARAARDGRARDLIFVEGLRLSEEAERSRLNVEDVLFTEKILSGERGRSVLDRLRRAGAATTQVSEGVLGSVADTKTPQGVVLLARRPPADQDSFERALKKDPLLVVLHGVNNPANAGAMVRVAEAAGAAGVVTTAGTTDPFSPKALRSAMGSAFRLPLWAGATFADVIAWCEGRGITTVATDLDATRAHTDLVWGGAKAVICGAEASGLSEIEIGIVDERVRIPMRAPVESLNVAAALAVVLYEAARQRGFADQI